MARTSQQKILPTAFQSRFFPGVVDGRLFSSGAAVMFPGQSVTVQVNTVAAPNTFTSVRKEYMMWGNMFSEMVDGLDLDALDQIIPQRGSGADVGGLESDFLIIGPFHPIWFRTGDEYKQVESNQLVTHQFVKNVSAGLKTARFRVQPRVLFTNKAIPISASPPYNGFTIGGAA